MTISAGSDPRGKGDRIYMGAFRTQKHSRAASVSCIMHNPEMKSNLDCGRLSASCA